MSRPDTGSLIALGWSEHQMKIEFPTSDRKRADVACFRHPWTKYLNKEDCSLIIETKAYNKGLDIAVKQGRQYLKAFPKCDRLAVTNGHCYKLYNLSQLSDDQQRPKLEAYLNLLKLPKHYPLDADVPGAIKAFELLMPTER